MNDVAVHSAMDAYGPLTVPRRADFVIKSDTDIATRVNEHSICRRHGGTVAHEWRMRQRYAGVLIAL